MVRKLVALIALCCLAACAGGRVVEGNRVNYGTGKVFTVAPSYLYLGEANGHYDEKIINKLMSSTGTYVNYVFARTYRDTNELTEILWVHIAKSSDRVIYDVSIRGSKPVSYYSIEKINKNFTELFEGRGYVTSKKFECLRSEELVETRRSSSIGFCVASSVIPAGADVHAFIEKQYSESLARGAQ